MTLLCRQSWWVAIRISFKNFVLKNKMVGTNEYESRAFNICHNNFNLIGLLTTYVAYIFFTKKSSPLPMNKNHKPIEHLQIFNSSNPQIRFNSANNNMKSTPLCQHPSRYSFPNSTSKFIIISFSIS